MSKELIYLMQEKIIKTDAVLNLLAEKNEQIKVQEKKYSQLYAKFRMVYHKYKEQNKEVCELRLKVNTCEGKHGGLIVELQILQHENHDLRNDYSKLLLNNQKHFAEYESKIRTLTSTDAKECKKCTEVMQKNGSLSQDNKSLKSKVKELDKKIDEIKTRNVQIDVKLSDSDYEALIKVHREEMQTLKQQHEKDLKEIKDQLKNDIESSQSMVISCEANKIVLDDTIESLKTQLCTANNTIETLRKEKTHTYQKEVFDNPIEITTSGALATENGASNSLFQLLNECVSEKVPNPDNFSVQSKNIFEDKINNFILEDTLQSDSAFEEGTNTRQTSVADSLEWAKGQLSPPSILSSHSEYTDDKVSNNTEKMFKSTAALNSPISSPKYIDILHEPSKPNLHSRLLRKRQAQRKRRLFLKEMIPQILKSLLSDARTLRRKKFLHTSSQLTNAKFQKLQFAKSKKLLEPTLSSTDSDDSTKTHHRDNRKKKNRTREDETNFIFTERKKEYAHINNCFKEMTEFYDSLMTESDNEVSRGCFADDSKKDLPLRNVIGTKSVRPDKPVRNDSSQNSSQNHRDISDSCENISTLSKNSLSDLSVTENCSKEITHTDAEEEESNGLDFVDDISSEDESDVESATQLENGEVMMDKGSAGTSKYQRSSEASTEQEIEINVPETNELFVSECEGIASEIVDGDCAEKSMKQTSPDNSSNSIESVAILPEVSKAPMSQNSENCVDTERTRKLNKNKSESELQQRITIKESLKPINDSKLQEKITEEKLTSLEIGKDERSQKQIDINSSSEENVNSTAEQIFSSEYKSIQSEINDTNSTKKQLQESKNGRKSTDAKSVQVITEFSENTENCINSTKLLAAENKNNEIKSKNKMESSNVFIDSKQQQVQATKFVEDDEESSNGLDFVDDISSEDEENVNSTTEQIFSSEYKSIQSEFNNTNYTKKQLRESKNVRKSAEAKSVQVTTEFSANTENCINSTKLFAAENKNNEMESTNKMENCNVFIDSKQQQVQATEFVEDDKESSNGLDFVNDISSEDETDVEPATQLEKREAVVDMGSRLESHDIKSAKAKNNEHHIEQAEEDLPNVVVDKDERLSNQENLKTTSEEEFFGFEENDINFSKSVMMASLSDFAELEYSIADIKLRNSRRRKLSSNVASLMQETQSDDEQKNTDARSVEVVPEFAESAKNCIDATKLFGAENKNDEIESRNKILATESYKVLIDSKQQLQTTELVEDEKESRLEQNEIESVNVQNNDHRIEQAKEDLPNIVVDKDERLSNQENWETSSEEEFFGFEEDDISFSKSVKLIFLSDFAQLEYSITGTKLLNSRRRKISSNVASLMQETQSEDELNPIVDGMELEGYVPITSSKRRKISKNMSLIRSTIKQQNPRGAKRKLCVKFAFLSDDTESSKKNINEKDEIRETVLSPKEPFKRPNCTRTQTYEDSDISLENNIVGCPKNTQSDDELNPLVDEMKLEGSGPTTVSEKRNISKNMSVIRYKLKQQIPGGTKRKRKLLIESAFSSDDTESLKKNINVKDEVRETVLSPKELFKRRNCMRTQTYENNDISLENNIVGRPKKTQSDELNPLVDGMELESSGSTTFSEKRNISKNMSVIRSTLKQQNPGPSKRKLLVESAFSSDDTESPKKNINVNDEVRETVLSPKELFKRPNRTRTQTYEDSDISLENNIVGFPKKSNGTNQLSCKNGLIVPEGERMDAKKMFKRPNCRHRNNVDRLMSTGIGKCLVQKVSFNQSIALDSPMSPEHETEYDRLPTEPITIPLERVGQLNKGHAVSLLKKLITLPDDTVTWDKVVKQFEAQEEDYIIRLILEEVSVDNSKLDITYTPPAPVLTSIQRTLLMLLVKLQDSMPNMLDSFLTVCEKFILSECNLPMISPVARLYLGVCKLQRRLHRMRRMICDTLYYIGDLAVPFLFTVLSTWIEILPLQSEDGLDNPLVKVLIQIINMKTCIKPGYNLTPLKKLLEEYYEYPKERWNSDEVFKEVFDVFKETPSDYLEYCLLILLKNHPSKWVCDKVNTNVIPVLSATKTSTHLRERSLSLLRNVVELFGENRSEPHVRALENCMLRLSVIGVI